MSVKATPFDPMSKYERTREELLLSIVGVSMTHEIKKRMKISRHNGNRNTVPNSIGSVTLKVFLVTEKDSGPVNGHTVMPMRNSSSSCK